MIHLFFELFRRLRMPLGSTALKVIVAVIVIVWFSASGYLYFEIQARPELTWADAFWWSLVTMTTVGYGDYFPETQLGRYLVGVPTMILGISVLGYLLSSVAAYLLESKSKELKGMKQIKLEDHILIVHFSDTNRVLQLAGELQADSSTQNKPIVLIDSELDELPAELDEIGIKFVRGNPARESTLLRANYTRATHAVVLSKNPTDVRSDDLNLAVALTIEGLGSDIRTVVECVDPDSIETLRRTGCDSIVCVGKLSSSLLVQELVDPGVQAVFDELSRIQVGQQIFVVDIASMEKWSYAELGSWGHDQRMLMLGVKRGGRIHINPGSDFALEQGDQAILIGDTRPEDINITAA